MFKQNQADSYEYLAGSKTSVPIALLVSRSCGVKQLDEELRRFESEAPKLAISKVPIGTPSTLDSIDRPWKEALSSVRRLTQRFVTLLLCSHAAAILEAIRPLWFIVQDSRNIAFD
jgi:hypothetical protein